MVRWSFFVLTCTTIWVFTGVEYSVCQETPKATKSLSGSCVTPLRLTGQKVTLAHVVSPIRRPIFDNTSPPTASHLQMECPTAVGNTEQTLSDSEIVLLPGLNTQFELSRAMDTAESAIAGMASQTVHVAQVPISSELLENTKIQTTQNEVACGTHQNLLESPQPGANTHSNVYANNCRMLEPLSENAMKKPKPHESEQEMMRTAEHLVTTVRDGDTTQSAEYSSTRGVEASESNSIERAIDADSKLQIEPNNLVTGLPLSGTLMNFSDTPAAFEDSTGQFGLGDRNHSGMVVHPPLVQPYNSNQYTFVVENRSQTLAKDVAIEVAVSENSKIIAALPENSVSSASKTIFKFDEIAAGDQLQIHLNAISKDGNPIDFEANVVTRSTYDFVAQDTTTGRLAKVSHQSHSADSSESDSNTIDNSQIGPTLVRNPFVGGNANQDHYSAGRPTDRH